MVGSHEFYLGYAVANDVLLCLDAGHFHPTEVISDKLSAVLTFVDEVLLHVSRGVRWDSDHVVLLTDELQAIAQEVVRGEYLDRVHIGLDFFDASINRVAAWVVGSRNTMRALLMALLEPIDDLRELEVAGNYTRRLAMLEALKGLPFGAVWDYFCLQQGVPVGVAYMDAIEDYERRVLSKRVSLERVILRTSDLAAEARTPIRRQKSIDDKQRHPIPTGRHVQPPGRSGAGLCHPGRGQHLGPRRRRRPFGSRPAATTWAPSRERLCARAFERTLELLRATPRQRGRRRDAAIKAGLNRAKVDPDDTRRPSVETVLHALALSLEGVNFVGHTHPTAINALTCSVAFETAAQGRLCPGRDRELRPGLGDRALDRSRPAPGAQGERADRRLH